MVMKNGMKKGISYLGLILFAFIFGFPFYFMMVLATVPGMEMYSYPPHLFFKGALIANIQSLFRQIPFMTNFFNSFGIASLSTISVVFFCTMGGFAFAKYDFKGKDKLFMIILSSMAIPAFLNIIPFFKMMINIGWYGTWLPLIVPGMANAFGIVLMTSFLKEAVHKNLMDAARIDGLSEFRILLQIAFPLARAGIGILGIVTFIGSWNNFLGALVMLPNLKNTTIPVALSKLVVVQLGEGGGVMVGNALAVLPLMVVFIAFNRRIISGLTAGSIKG